MEDQEGFKAKMHRSTVGEMTCSDTQISLSFTCNFVSPYCWTINVIQSKVRDSSSLYMVILKPVSLTSLSQDFYKV